MALHSALIGHQLERFGMVTVLDATFYDVATGEALVSFDTLKMSNISSEGQQKEIRGGQGAELLLTYDFGRTANVEITDALASMYSIQYLWGGKLAKEEFSYLVKHDYTVVTTNTLPVAMPTRKVKTPWTVNNKTTQVSTPSAGIDEEGDDIAMTVLASVGDQVTLYYTSTAEPGITDEKAHIHQLTLTATDFPPIVKFVGDTFVIDQDTGTKIHMQIEIPRFKLDANFSFTLEAEGDASVFDFSGVALSDNGNIIFLRTLGEVV